MAHTQLTIMAHDRLMDIFEFIARELGTSQALAALEADKKETELLLARYVSAPRGTMERGDRAWWKRNLSKRLGCFDAIEAAIQAGVTDDHENDEDDEAEHEESSKPGPVLVWTNPTRPAAA